MLVTNDCCQLRKALSNLALTQSNPQQMLSFRRAWGLPKSLWFPSCLSLYSGSTNQIKNFSAHRLLQLGCGAGCEPRWCAEKSPSSADGQALPSSMCKALAGSTASTIHSGSPRPWHQEFKEQLRGCILDFLSACQEPGCNISSYHPPQPGCSVTGLAALPGQAGERRGGEQHLLPHLCG